METPSLSLCIVKDTEIDVLVVKQLLREVQTKYIDPVNILLKLQDGVSVTLEARSFLKRIEKIYAFRGVAVIASSMSSTLQANFYQSFYKPCYPYKVFNQHEAAKAWLDGLNQN